MVIHHSEATNTLEQATEQVLETLFWSRRRLVSAPMVDPAGQLAKPVRNRFIRCVHVLSISYKATMPISPQGRIQAQKRQEVTMSALSRPYEAISSDKAGLQLLSHPAVSAGGR
jgi:hypothetical protein